MDPSGLKHVEVTYSINEVLI